MFRSIRMNEPEVSKNWAELLWDWGRVLRRRIRRGAGIEEASRDVRWHPKFGQLALAFVSSSDQLKLRAMVEDWSLVRIARELGGMNWLQAAPAKAEHWGENTDFMEFHYPAD